MQYPTNEQPKEAIQTGQYEPRPAMPYPQQAPQPAMPPFQQQQQYPPMPVQPQYPQQQQWQQPPYPYQQQPYPQPGPQYAPQQPQQPIMIVNNVQATANATAMAGMMPMQKTQYGFMLRLLYFCFVGWWLAMLWAAFALGACCTIVGMPLGVVMLNKLPAVLTLQR